MVTSQTISKKSMGSNTKLPVRKDFLKTKLNSDPKEDTNDNKEVK